MTQILQENIRNIIFYYIKQKYSQELINKKKNFLSDNDINYIVNQLYSSENNKIKKYIRDCLKDMMLENYNSALVENIIFEIFDDEELAKNRVILEIKNYQLHKESKNNIYEVQLTPHDKYGLGLKLDFDSNDIVVSNLKKNPDDNTPLPAELSKIRIGDSIIKINSESLEYLDSKHSVDIIKKYIESKQTLNLTLRTFHSQ